MTGRRSCVGSGVMGSDGFESKKLGGPSPGGAGTEQAWAERVFGCGRARSRTSMRCRAWATAPPTSSKSAASSNGSMHQRATASSFPTMAGRMCCCMSRCSGATAIKPPMRARGWSANACSGPKAIRRSASFRWTRSTAIHPAQMLPPRTHVSVTPTSGLERAQVKWFNRLRGFGFLTCGEGTPDIFVHMETLRRFGMTELRPGQYVLVRFGPGSKGMMAAEIQPETGSPGLVVALIARHFHRISPINPIAETALPKHDCRRRRRCGLVFAMIVAAWSSDRRISTSLGLSYVVFMNFVSAMSVDQVGRYRLRAWLWIVSRRLRRAVRVQRPRRAGGQHPAARNRDQDRRACVLGRDGDDRRRERPPA